MNQIIVYIKFYLSFIYFISIFNLAIYLFTLIEIKLEEDDK